MEVSQPHHDSGSVQWFPVWRRGVAPSTSIGTSIRFANRVNELSRYDAPPGGASTKRVPENKVYTKDLTLPYANEELPFSVGGTGTCLIYQ